MLFEIPESQWWAGVDRYELETPDPGYRQMMEWQRGKCFHSIDDVRAAYALRDHVVTEPRVAIFMSSNASSVAALAQLHGQTLEPAAVGDAIAKAPDLTGLVGRAWRCDLAALRTKLNVPAEEDGTVSAWVVEAPWAHPAWHSYAITLVHLRPHPKFNGQTKFYLAGATHEFWLYAMDPAAKRADAIGGEESSSRHWLTPINFAAQIIAESDDAASARIEDAIRLIVDGKLSPDSDFTSAWAKMFGDNMLLGRAR